MRTTASDDRLLAWNHLRQQNKDNDLEQALLNINNWWQMLPIDTHYLHWDDQRNWPDPWDLIADGVFCSLTKALGITYTILLLDRQDIQTVELAQDSDGDNLVLVNKNKYILNWAPDEILNIQSLTTKISEIIDSSMISHKIN